MQSRQSSIASSVANYFYTLNPIKTVVLLCLVFAAFVTIPDQTLELYRYTAQGFADSARSRFHDDTQGLVGFVVLVVSVLLLSLVLFVVAAFLFSLHAQGTAEFTSRFSRAAVATIAAAPGVAVAGGLVLAAHGIQADKLQDVLLPGARLSFAKDF